MKHIKCTYLAGLAVVGTSFSVSADVLTFDAADACSPALTSCVDWDLIDQNYGDGAGVDFVWGDVSLGDAPGMQFWGEWGGTTDALFSGVDDEESIAQIDIIALSGFSVTLNGFDLTAFDEDRTSQWTIQDLAGGTVLSSGGMIDVFFPDLTSVVADLTSSAGFRVSWGPSSYNVGLDNLSYDVSSVPEPGTLLLFGLGLAGLGAIGRKKKV